MTPRRRKTGSVQGSACLAGVLVGIPLLAGVGSAQPTPMPSVQEPIWVDGSVGAAAGVATPIPLEVDTYHIGDEWGAYSHDGGTLFHSFLYFGLPIPGTIASLQASPDAEQILLRVTGGLESIIDGTIRAEPDLFLMNPAGIQFRSSARLDVGGSFHATTADYLGFGEDVADFEASVAAPLPLMVSAPPAAFGFTSPTPRPIGFSLNRGDTYDSFDSGGTLSLVGGDVEISLLPSEQGPSSPASQGRFTKQLKLPRAPLQVASAGSPMEIPVDLGELGAEAMPAGMGAVSLSGVDIRVDGGDGEAAGRIFIRAGRFEMKDDASRGIGRGGLYATHNAETDAEGGIDIVAADSVFIGGGSRIEAISGFQAGPSGDVSIVARNVRIEGDETGILLATYTDGAAGTLRIDAEESIEIADASLLVSESSPFAFVEDPSYAGSGRGAPIDLSAQRIEITNAGKILSATSGQGAGGSISMVAESVRIHGLGSRVEAHSGNTLPSVFLPEGGPPHEPATGTGGVVTISASSVELLDGGVVQSRSDSAGDGGDISIVAERLEVEGSGDRDGARISSLGFGEGGGGDVSLVVREVELRAGGQIFADTEGPGDAGDLSIRHAQRVLLSGASVDSEGTLRPSGLTSRARDAASGSSGRIDVSTRVLDIADGAQVAVSTFGRGNAGAIGIEASERITLRSAPGSDPSVISAASVGADLEGLAEVGDAGTIHLRAGRLEIFDGGNVTTTRNGAVSSDGSDIPGAGSLLVEAGDLIISGAGSGIYAKAATPPSLPAGREARSGGNVTLIVDADVTLVDGATVNADSREGLGDAGNIFLQAGRVFTSDASSVETAASNGALGGEIQIEAGEAIEITNSLVSAEVGTGEGSGGNITISGLGGEGSPTQAVALNRSTIFARAVGGAGGDISIVTDGYLESGDTALDASSDRNVDGRIRVSSPANDVTVELAALPVALLDRAGVAASACASVTEETSSFQVQRRRALRLPPDLALGAREAGSGEPCGGEETVQ